MKRATHQTQMTIEKTRVYRRLANNLADFLHRRKVAYDENDLYRVIMYVSGQQRATDFDVLHAYTKMIIDMLPSKDDMRFIPEVQ